MSSGTLGKFWPRATWQGGIPSLLAGVFVSLVKPKEDAADDEALGRLGLHGAAFLAEPGAGARGDE